MSWNLRRHRRWPTRLRPGCVSVRGRSWPSGRPAGTKTCVSGQTQLEMKNKKTKKRNEKYREDEKNGGRDKVAVTHRWEAFAFVSSGLLNRTENKRKTSTIKLSNNNLMLFVLCIRLISDYSVQVSWTQSNMRIMFSGRAHKLSPTFNSMSCVHWWELEPVLILEHTVMQQKKPKRWQQHLWRDTQLSATDWSLPQLKNNELVYSTPLDGAKLSPSYFSLSFKDSS